MNSNVLHVVEVFRTLQGEGINAGRAAVFVRLAGCNMWDGLEEHRERGQAACAAWCDTYFARGTMRTLSQLVDAVRTLQRDAQRELVVFTGGEPTLQLARLTTAELYWLRAELRATMCLETNGSRPLGSLRAHFDHVCVSPKRPDVEVKVRSGEELKLIWPHYHPKDYAALARGFRHLFVQPCDERGRRPNALHAAEYVQAHPEWRLSVQTHKTIGLP
jgi:7-carboxy-7-deazaguanine synthase